MARKAKKTSGKSFRERDRAHHARMKAIEDAELLGRRAAATGRLVAGLWPLEAAKQLRRMAKEAARMASRLERDAKILTTY